MSKELIKPIKSQFGRDRVIDLLTGQNLKVDVVYIYHGIENIPFRNYFLPQDLRKLKNDLNRLEGNKTLIDKLLRRDSTEINFLIKYYPVGCPKRIEDMFYWKFRNIDGKETRSYFMDAEIGLWIFCKEECGSYKELHTPCGKYFSMRAKHVVLS